MIASTNVKWHIDEVPQKKEYGSVAERNVYLKNIFLEDDILTDI